MSIAVFGKGIGGAVEQLFAGRASEAKADMFRIEAKADLLKGEGARLEGLSYGRAHELALQNKQYAETSTEVQLAQASRAITMSLGSTRAAGAASGFTESGSGIDILAASARQGELEKQMLAQQGLITEASHQEQADVYANMVKASEVAVEGSKLAHEGHLRAADAEEDAAKGHFLGAAINGVVAVGSLFTGGAAGAIGAAVGGALIPGNWGEQS